MPALENGRGNWEHKGYSGDNNVFRVHTPECVALMAYVRKHALPVRELLNEYRFKLRMKTVLSLHGTQRTIKRIIARTYRH